MTVRVDPDFLVSWVREEMRKVLRDNARTLLRLGSEGREREHRATARGASVSAAPTGSTT